MNDTLTEIFTRYGYDQKDPGRGLEIPDRLIEDLGLEDDDEADTE